MIHFSSAPNISEQSCETEDVHSALPSQE